MLQLHRIRIVDSPSDCPCRGVSYHSAKILRRSIAAAPQPGGRLGSFENGCRVCVCVCLAERLFGRNDGAGCDACGCRRYGDAKTDKERYELRSDVVEVRVCLLVCCNSYTTSSALLAAACCMCCFAEVSQIPSITDFSSREVFHWTERRVRLPARITMFRAGCARVSVTFRCGVQCAALKLHADVTVCNAGTFKARRGSRVIGT